MIDALASLRKLSTELEAVIFLPLSHVVVIENSGVIGQKSSCVATVYWVSPEGEVQELDHQFYDEYCLPDEPQEMRYERPLVRWVYQVLSGGQIAATGQWVSRLQLFDDYARVNTLEWKNRNQADSCALEVQSEDFSVDSTDTLQGLSTKEAIELGLNHLAGDLFEFHGVVFCLSSDSIGFCQKR